jgi:tetratricopeptide (TPR) repeat protein
LEQYEQAFADFATAIGLDPENTDPHNCHCWWRSLTGDAEMVVYSHCRQAVDLSTSHYLGFYQDIRGLARSLTGDYAGAIEDFRAFVECVEQNDYDEETIERHLEWICQLEAARIPLTK